MRWRIPLVVVLALFVAVSCDQKLVEPAADQVAEAPAFNWMNNPDNGNIRIDRGETHWIMCWTDPDNGFRACHATYPLGGATPDPDCGLQEDADLLEWQDVGEWVEPEWWTSEIHEVLKGDVFITVRDENTAGECFGDALVAEGWGRLMINDNDIFGVEEGDPNANTWQFKGQGQLVTPDGEKAAYNGKMHFIYSEAGGFKVAQLFVRVR